MKTHLLYSQFFLALITGGFGRHMVFRFLVVSNNRNAVADRRSGRLWLRLLPIRHCNPLSDDGFTFFDSRYPPMISRYKTQVEEEFPNFPKSKQLKHRLLSFLVNDTICYGHSSISSVHNNHTGRSCQLLCPDLHFWWKRLPVATNGEVQIALRSVLSISIR